MAKPGPFTPVVAVEGAKRSASPRQLAVFRAVIAGERAESAGATTLSPADG